MIRRYLLSLKKINLKLFILFQALACGQNLFAWDGPPPLVGGGLMSLAHPSSYLEASIFGSTNGQVPQNSRFKINALVFEDEKDVGQINFKLESFQLPNSISLGATGISAPSNLYSIDIGATFKRQIDGAHDWGLIASTGSDSDIPFNSPNELEANLTATYHSQIDPLHAWVFLLNYSKTRSFLPGLPLPGLGYLVIDPQSHTQIFYGLPFFFGWQPSKQLKFSASYLLISTMNFEIEFLKFAPVKIFSAFQWTSQVWLRANRPDSSQHIIFDQKRLILGASRAFGENFYANIFGGFAFDQKMTEAISLTTANSVYNYFPASIIAQAQIAYSF